MKHQLNPTRIQEHGKDCTTEVEEIEGKNNHGKSDGKYAGKGEAIEGSAELIQMLIPLELDSVNKPLQEEVQIAAWLMSRPLNQDNFAVP